MKTNALLTIAAGLAALAPVAMADINQGQAIVPNMTAQMRGNCDLMASNTVRATFKGLRSIPVQTLDEAQPSIAKVAEFEVIENLAHRRYVRYGDGAMPTGMRFTVALDREMPGQPADVADKIAQMKPGDEAVLKMDHLFLFAEPEGRNLRPCTRMAVKPADQPTSQPLPTAVAPLMMEGSGKAISTSTSISLRPDGKGGMVEERIDVRSEYDSATGLQKTRMFINGQEVDPQTRKPIQQKAAAPVAAPAATAAPAAAVPPAAPAAPAAQVPGSKAQNGDDTIVEKPTLPQEESF